MRPLASRRSAKVILPIRRTEKILPATLASSPEREAGGRPPKRTLSSAARWVLSNL